MPVQQIHDTSSTPVVLERNNARSGLHETLNAPKWETNGNQKTSQILTSNNNNNPPSIPERTSASNLDQLKTSDLSKMPAPKRRVTSPSSGTPPNQWIARKTSFQCDRIVPNDDLVLSKARATGTRNYSPMVGIFLLFKISVLF